MQCKFCGCTSMYLKDTPTHVGLYCANAICNKWHTWVGSKKLSNYANLPRYGVNDIPRLVQSRPTIENSGMMDAYPPPQEDSVDFLENEGNNYPTYIQSPEPIQEQHYQSYQPQSQVAVKQEPITQFNYATMCVSCISGVVPSIEENEMFTMQYKSKTGLLLMVSKRTNEVVFSSKVKYCPTCGTPSNAE